MSSTDTDDIRTGHEENEEYWPREQEAAPADRTTAEAAQSDEASEESDEADELDETGEFDELGESGDESEDEDSEDESEDEDADAGAYDATPQPEELTPGAYDTAPQSVDVTPQPDEIAPQPDEIASQPDEAAPRFEGVARPEDLGGRNLGEGAQPLLSADEQQEFLTEWTRIQVSFVEDPPTAVQNADALVQSITTSLLTALNTRSGDLAAEGGAASDTEQLRLALRQYRAFIGVLLPEQESTVV